jgi:hypothetical protein
MGLITLILLLLYFVLFGVAAVDDQPVAQVERPTTAAIQPTPPSGGWQHIGYADFQGVIVAEADAPDFARSAGWDEAEGYWTPSPDDVVALEAELEDAWAAEAPPAARDQNLTGHTRQYVGGVEDGEWLIRVNAFCDALGIDWQREPVVVADGGACYFQATWDVERAEFRALMVNGEA